MIKLTPEQEAVARRHLRNTYEYERAYAIYYQSAGESELARKLNAAEEEYHTYNNRVYGPMLYRLDMASRMEIGQEVGLDVVRHIAYRAR